MYCDNCGAKVEKGKKFCDNCGSTVRKAKPSDYKEVEKKISSEDKHLPYQPTPPALQRRSISVALISLFLPGIGHIYVDKLLSGVGFFFGAIGIGTLAGIFLDWGWNYASYVVFAILVSYLIGGTVYVTLLIRRYNRFLEKNLRKPTPKEKW
ncbi:MAG: zinc-ribbon domain-containing protein [Candidatus Heimdallarchaeaceae archaeon]